MGDIKNRKEFEAAVRELAELIKERTTTFPNDTPEKQVERVKKCRGDLLDFAKTYFPHYVSSEFADFHREEAEKVSNAIRSGDSSILAQIWSRGFGKSSIFAIIFPVWATINGYTRFTIFVGADRELSKERTSAIRLEYQHNARIRGDFPAFAMDESNGEEYDFNTPENSRFRAQGYQQGIRGKVNGPHRPRLIIIDDLESHKDTNPRIAKKKYDYVMEEAFGALGEKGGLLVWLGNLTNSASALSMFVKKCDTEPNNKYVGYRKILSEENGKSNWEVAFPIKKLHAIESVIGKTGYARHYLMKPGIDGDVFKEEWLLQYNPYNPHNEELVKAIKNAGFSIVLPTIEELDKSLTITYCDPSLGGGETNDFKAIYTIAQYGGLYYIRDIHIRRESIIDMLRYMYDLDKRYKTRLYMEKNFWQKLIWQYLPKLAEEYGYMLPITGIENRLNKNERILSLEPLFQWGHIINTCIGEDTERHKEQFVGFPNADNDDGPDALSGCIARFKEVSIQNRYDTVESSPTDFRRMF